VSETHGPINLSADELEQLIGALENCGVRLHECQHRRREARR